MWPNLEDFIKHLNSWLLFLYNYFFMSVLFFDWERKYFVMQTGIIKSCSENLFFKLNSKNKTFKKKNQFLYIPYSKILFRLKQISSQMQDFFLGSKAFFFKFTIWTKQFLFNVWDFHHLFRFSLINHIQRQLS